MKVFNGSWEVLPMRVPPSTRSLAASHASSQSGGASFDGSSVSQAGRRSSVRRSFLKKSAKAVSPLKPASNAPLATDEATVGKDPEESKRSYRMASQVILKQAFTPAMVPPALLERYARGISASTMQSLLEDLQKEARRIREGEVDEGTSGALTEKQIKDGPELAPEWRLGGESRAGGRRKGRKIRKENRGD
eukprot:TRINITY_DN8591_c0_g2_i1.p1 TRINITY_DN8591_c0_g2~~TRINITY_DN8591_c0_g2_i1.p1  ORF type:complete len:206 (-),score=24.60 TRINITY_DN8591_c0_g2_i1:751-1326(-)